MRECSKDFQNINYLIAFVIASSIGTSRNLQNLEGHIKNKTVGSLHLTAGSPAGGGGHQENDVIIFYISLQTLELYLSCDQGLQ